MEPNWPLLVAFFSLLIIAEAVTRFLEVPRALTVALSLALGAVLILAVTRGSRGS